MAAYQPTLKTIYREQIVAALMKEFGYTSVMQVPRLQKIVVNQGMGQAVADKKLIEVAPRSSPPSPVRRPLPPSRERTFRTQVA